VAWKDVVAKMSGFEICKECYTENFPNYKDMEIKVSYGVFKCCCCGEVKQAVRKVTANGKVIDIN